ncbi:MAG: MarR family winged helix-turn-helix transcriptional regulator [Oscillospiraceae bacterium]
MENNLDIGKFLLFQRQVGDFYNSAISKCAAQCNLSKPEADVILFLANNTQYKTATEVVEHRGFSKGYVSKAVEQLQSKGLISIKTGKEDRRYQYIEVLPQAAQTIEELRGAQLGFWAAVSRDINGEDIISFNRLVVQLLKNISE